MRIVASHSFADGLAAALGERPRAPVAPLAVWVEWDATERTSEPFTLTARSGGAELARASAAASHAPLALELDEARLAGLAHGCTIVVELRWPRGARHRHLLRPLQPSCLALDNLLAVSPSAAEVAAEDLSEGMAAAAVSMPPSYWWRSLSTAAPSVDAMCAPRRALRLSEVERGFGVEIELITVAGPGRPGRLTLINPGLGAALDEIAARCVAASPGAAATLRRCLRWQVGDDAAIRPACAAAAARTIEACGVAAADAPRAAALLGAAPRAAHRTELRSPAPPLELSFSDGAADEVRCLLGLVRHAGAAATSVCRCHTTLLSDAGAACDSGTAVHVHVNVLHEEARGAPLSARALLRVVLAWVRYDAVTQRFARAWMWREPSCAPLLATGPEFVRAAAEAGAPDAAAATEEGDGGGGEGGGGGEEGGDGGGAEGGGEDGEEAAGWEWDVPAFFRRAHALLRSAHYGALGEAARVEALFGAGSPAAGLGRYCALNLRAVRKYGTLEVRRFHASLDGDLIAHWAHFCVAFVEVFGGGDPEGGGGGGDGGGDGHGDYSEEALLQMESVEAALAALQAAQERATAAELMHALRDYVDPATAVALMADAVGDCKQQEEPHSSSS